VAARYAGFYTAWKLEKRCGPEEVRGRLRPASLHAVPARYARGGSGLHSSLTPYAVGLFARQAPVDHRGHHGQASPRSTRQTRSQTSKPPVGEQWSPPRPTPHRDGHVVVHRGRPCRQVPDTGRRREAIASRTSKRRSPSAIDVLTNFDKAANLPEGTRGAPACSPSRWSEEFRGIDDLDRRAAKLRERAANSTTRHIRFDETTSTSSRRWAAYARGVAQDQPWVIKNLAQRGEEVTSHASSSASAARSSSPRVRPSRTELIVWTAGVMGHRIRNTRLPVEERAACVCRPDRA